jgi:hypothetical protein
MLNTFENKERFHQRRLERERHISNMEVFSRVIENEEGRLTMADALSSFPLAKNDESLVTTTRKGRKTKVYVGIVLAVIGLVLVSILSALGGLKYEGNMPNKNSFDSTPESHSHRHAQIFSLVLDWGITPRSRLEDPSSAANMALQWLADEDVLTDNPEDLRIRYSLATLFYGTQNKMAGHTWSRSSYWLSSYRK